MRVLSTAEAKTAIRQSQSIIADGSADQISQLGAQGRVLPDPGAWGGPSASLRG
jgi:hypothetical protein